MNASIFVYLPLRTTTNNIIWEDYTVSACNQNLMGNQIVNCMGETEKWGKKTKKEKINEQYLTWNVPSRYRSLVE